jgi:hypothetical protein
MSAVILSGGKIVGSGGKVYSTNTSGLPLLFFDNFSSGDLSHTQNGVSWIDGANVSVIANPTGLQPPSGNVTDVLQFSYNTGNESEQRFLFGNGPYLEYAIQWDIFYPAGFALGTGTPTNNKMNRMWNGNPSDGNDGYTNFYFKTGASTVAGSGSNICGFINEYGAIQSGVNGVGQFGNNGSQANAGNYIAGITNTDPGSWMTWKLHAKCATVANNNGVTELYKNGTLVASAYNLPLYPTDNPTGNGAKYGNILGFANTGFPINPQLIQVANVFIYGQ